ncbi:hypothetical protein A3F07_00475 [candidate division WWE3 bacterium RIFCSPHIGHO2_12_FULL_38_15]|uniref:Uncharacterized protein n=1 Tax=candidate division WWE3 bacterium RIFCSPHIGHO2_02_FULL_38_14 TaxID=1802620 RepID=A0A1F4VBB5_UNCKA|nr:MAG: hypothetical protein A2793_00565 [candidate division WWE3 bacterium RIFCSPHIGHO2_01_FULL_38_45]OGC49050.1 MAG: hypothetical protein A3F07_00475 [candidate division WWE3 bacterium RIFCSPHIGHO2_12_FULL_38_15]OGC53505.1 MAG: hypothetical protein A3B64_04110 [candidate division WWE3 bacterium RIFCSPLOWO2_01_FULL_37_24]OGC54409.1 MAG: hypothetical protein A3D91_00740 [candidate division WWE3 bacterium RIFCSPHIGHO2_02_FULL_38_14]HLB51653.1 hypothetical protein [Patescibacteria group bacterium
MKKIFYIYVCIVLLSVISLGIVLAAFTYKNKYIGSTFTIGSAVIKLLQDLSIGPDTSNLTDELPGPLFDNISEGWKYEYPIKIFNSGTTRINLSSRANYTTANDPDNLRDIIYVEVFEWNDSNYNGLYDSEEKGASFGAPKTILRWKNDGIDMGQMDSAQTSGFLLTFSTPSVTDTKQGKSGLFDFEFNSLSL